MKPIVERIRDAMNGRTQAQYHEIMRLVFPREHFPRAFIYQSDGGPPGCAMAFGKALRRIGGCRMGGIGSHSEVYVPRKKE